MTTMEEKLSEAVRQFPVLYDKSNHDFKDRNKKKLAWDDVATSAGLESGDCAKRIFANLRNKYGRDKKRLQSAKRSGTDTSSVKDAEKDISELYPYLQWLEPYVQPRQSCTNLVNLTETSEALEESDCESGSLHNVPVSPASSCSSEKSSCLPAVKVETSTSKVTGYARYTKRSKAAASPVEKAELELINFIGSKLNQQEQKQQAEKNEDSLFADLIATQLQQLPVPKRIIVKMEINNLIYKHLLESMEKPMDTSQFPPVETSLGNTSYASRFTPSPVNSENNDPQSIIPAGFNPPMGNSAHFAPGHFFHLYQNR